MVKVIGYCIVIVLIFAGPGSGSALLSNIPDSAEMTYKLHAPSESNLQKYRLVSLPSTNKKRVDVMCARFLSLIPKAMLIPKTEERTIYRLIATTFDTIEPAKKLKTKLLQHCESPFVIKNDHGFTVIAGSQLTEASALAEQKRLAGKNISTTIRELRLPLKQWQMNSTESFTIRDAVIMASRLAKIGVITTLEPAAY